MNNCSPTLKQPTESSNSFIKCSALFLSGTSRAKISRSFEFIKVVKEFFGWDGQLQNENIITVRLRLMKNAFRVSRHYRLVLNGRFGDFLASEFLIHHKRNISARSDGMNRSASKP